MYRARCAAAFPTLLLALLALAGCGGPLAEEALRERIAGMEEALESNDVGAFMDGVADNFIGGDGLDRQRLQAMLRAQMLRSRRIAVTLGPLDIVVDGEQAHVRFSVVTTGGSGGLLPDRAGTYEVDSRWRREGDDWRVVTADWSRGL